MARLKRRMATLRVGDPLDKNTDIGAINSAEQLAKIRELSDIGEAEGAGRWSPPCELPKHGFWFPPTLFTDVTQAHRIAREEIFGPVLSVLTFRTPDEAVEKANNTPYGLSAGVWTDKGSRILWMANKLRAGVVWANTFNKFDPDQPVRRLQGVRLRPRGRPPRPRGLPARVSDREPRRRPQDLQALHRRRSSRARSPGTPTSSTTPRGSFVANAALASRKDARDAVLAARAAFGGWSGRTAYNRAQILYRVAEIMEDRRPQFVEAVRQSEGLTPTQAGKVVDAAIDRLVWYAGWADKITQVVGNANPVAGPYFNLSTPEPTGVVAVVAPQQSSLLGLVSVVAPVDRHRQHGRGAQLVRAPAAGRDLRRGAGHLRRARRGGQHPHRLGWPTPRRGWPPTWTSTRIDLTGVAGDPELARGARGGGRREPQAGTPRPRRRARLDRRARHRADDRRSWRPRPSGTRSASDPRTGHDARVRARIVVLAGPSGAGKSRLAERLGLPVLRLDDFYKNGDDPTLPRITEGANAGHRRLGPPGLVAARRRGGRDRASCAATGSAEVPVYDIAQDGRYGSQQLDLGEHRLFVAEGIFAQEVVARVPRRAGCSRRRTACASTRW